MIPFLTNPSVLPPWILLMGGAALGWLRNFWSWLHRHTIGQVTQRIMVEVSIEEVDHPEAWLWLSHWVEKRLRSRKIGRLQLRKQSRRRSAILCAEEEEPATGYELVPGYGVYPFLWRKLLLVFSSGKEDAQSPGGSAGSNHLSMPRRTASLTIWGSRNRDLLLEVIDDARREWEHDHPAAQQYYYHRYSYWNSRPLAPRRSNTLYLPPGTFEEILEDARQFLSSREVFEQLGVPWRRGYMFYGPPGTGKTTLVQVLATELRLPLYYLSLASVRDRSDLAQLLDTVQPGSIVLIEDIDCIAAAAARMSQEDSDGNAAAEKPGTSLQATSVTTAADQKLTPSDLLNQIDGIVASEGRLLIMTTNYPEKLDVALVRPGRVDRRWGIGFARRAELGCFYDRAKVHGFASISFEEYIAILGPKATIAAAQALLMRGSTELAGVAS